MKIGSAARFQIEPRVNVVALCKQARNDVLKRCRAGGFMRMNFRDTEFTRQLSRRRPERLCRARHLSIILSLRDQPLPNCTAGPAPAVLSLNVRLRDTDRTRSPRQASPSLVVHPV